MVLIICGYRLFVPEMLQFIQEVYSDKEQPDVENMLDMEKRGYCIVMMSSWLRSVHENEHTVGFSCEYTFM